MLQHLESLIPDTAEDLQWLGNEVRARLIEVVAVGDSQVTREYEDELAYLSMDLNRSVAGQDATVRIEFGVQDSNKRLATGVFVGRWSGEHGRLGELEMILLQGVHADVSPFVTSFKGYLDLPATTAEVVEQPLN